MMGDDGQLDAGALHQFTETGAISSKPTSLGENEEKSQ